MSNVKALTSVCNCAPRLISCEAQQFGAPQGTRRRRLLTRRLRLKQSTYIFSSLYVQRSIDHRFDTRIALRALKVLPNLGLGGLRHKVYAVNKAVYIIRLRNEI